MKRLLFFTLLISAVTLTAYWGTQKLCTSCLFKGHGPQVSFKALDLTAEQQSRIAAKQSTYQKQADELCMKICAGRLEVLRLIKDPAASQEMLDAKIDEVGKLQSQLEKEVARHLRDVRADLEPAQYEKFMEQIRREIHESMNQMAV